MPIEVDRMAGSGEDPAKADLGALTSALRRLAVLADTSVLARRAAREARRLLGIDLVANGEGIGGLAGVPVHVWEQLMGVLYGPTLLATNPAPGDGAAPR